MAELSLEDGTLYYEDHGAGEPLVFIHGGWMSGDAWGPQVEHFADDYRVIVHDVRGHGRTGASGTENYSIELFAEDLHRLLEHLEIERANLCGLSLGSMVVQSYLATHPERVRAAVLGGPVQTLPPVDLPPATKAMFSPRSALSASLSMTGSRATFRTLLRSIRATTGGPWLSLDREVRGQALDAAGDVEPGEFRKVFDALYGFEPPELAGLEVPTLFVFGGREAPLVKQQARRLAGTVDGEVVAVPDAAHLVNLDQPAAFNRTSEAFLANPDAS